MAPIGRLAVDLQFQPRCRFAKFFGGGDAYACRERSSTGLDESAQDFKAMRLLPLKSRRLAAMYQLVGM